jgi:hypothetical protein
LGRFGDGARLAARRAIRDDPRDATEEEAMTILPLLVLPYLVVCVLVFWLAFRLVGAIERIAAALERGVTQRS